MLIKRFPLRAITIALATVVSQHTFAEQVSENTGDIERVEVWSTAVNASSVYLKGDAIDNKQADHLSDLLRTIPGVDVGGAHSLNQRITIRSMDDKDLGISIDGAKQNSYMYHHMGNLQIHADILKSVDIEVGSNSVINGGLGGTVRFETKEARELLKEEQSFGGRVQLSTSDNSGDNYSVTGYGLLGVEFDFLAYYNGVKRDNYDVGGGEIKDSQGIKLADTDGTVRGFSGDLNDSLIKLGWNVTDNQRVQLSYEHYIDEGDYSYRPDMGLATDLAITNSLEVPLLWPTKFSRDTLTLNYELAIENTLLKAAAYNNVSELWRDETKWATNPVFSRWAAVVTGEAKNTGFNVIAETAVDGELSHDITYGVDYVKHTTDYHAKQTASTTHSAEEAENLALFIQDRISLNDKFTLIPGIRYDKYSIESVVIDENFSDTSLALALEFQASNDLLFKLSATELFKGPEIGEVFAGAGLSDKANADIVAETGVNAELSFAYQTQALGADSLSFGATVFNTEIDDYIYDYATPPAEVGGRSWKDNIGDLSIDGFEAYVIYQFDQFEGQLSYSRAESELSAIAQYQDLEGARLDRQQGDTISAKASYFLTQWNVSLNWEVLYVDDVNAALDLDGASLDNSKQGFKVHNLSAKWQPESLSGLAVILGVDNLFDEYYASQSSRTGVSFHPRFGELYLQDYEPGRNIKATVSYLF